MSLFKNDIQVIDAISYFKSFTDERKAFVVSNLLKLNGADKSKLEPLILAILHDISNYDKITVSNQLHKLGLDETFATLFVQTLLNQIPPLKYMLKQISSINDADFKIKFSSIVNDIIVEHKETNDIIEEHNITKEQEKNITSINQPNIAFII